MKKNTLTIAKVRKRFGTIVAAADHYQVNRRLIYAAITLDRRNAARKPWVDKHKLRDRLKEDCLT